MEEEGLLLLETGTCMDDFLQLNCTSPEQEYIVLQPDVGIDNNDEATTSKVQAGAREEFARLPIGRQQRETASTVQSKQFERGRSQCTITFLKRDKCFWRIYCLFARCFPSCVLSTFYCCISTVLSEICRSRYERR